MSDPRLPPDHVELLHKLQAHLTQYGAQGWLVGGYVRDLLLGRESGDLDVAVEGDAPGIARAFADETGGAWVLLDDATGLARVVWPEGARAGDRPKSMDLVRLRAPTIEADLRGRDVTINALALPLEAVDQASEADLIDPLGGLDDIRQGLLRPCSPQAIADDPLRMLRAVRIGAELRFVLGDELQTHIRQERASITTVSVERIRDEILKLLALPASGAGVRYLDEVGLLTTIIPELEPARDCDQPVVHFLPVLAHLLEAVVAGDWLLDQVGLYPEEPARSTSLAALGAFPEMSAPLRYNAQLCQRMRELVDGMPRGALFKLALLLHDVAKPQTKATKPDGGVSFYDHQTIGAEVAWAIARRLRLSRAACDYVRLVVREHMRPGQLNSLGAELSMRAVYRFFRATGEAGPDVLLHSLCDHLAMKGPLLNPGGWRYHVEWTAALLKIFYEGDEAPRREPLLRGDDLMAELKLEPGPIIGRLLEEVREAQAVGEVRTREDALEVAGRALRLIVDQGPVVRQQEDQQRAEAE